jgi:purine nucleosidase
MTSTPIVIDTDNSLGELGSEVDDAFALGAALGESALEVMAVTTVFGNTDVASATALTRELLDGLGAVDLPVHRGAARPVRRPLRAGLPDSADSSDAVSALARLARQRPGELVLVAIGPLTNVARLLENEPDAARQLREIVVMGGAYLRTTGRADLPGEFNFWNDPDAVATVFASGVPLRLVGLDVTEQVRLNRAEAAELEARGGPLGRLGRYATRWIEATAARRPGDPLAATGCAMHDALAVAAVVHPELFDWAPAQVRIETESELTRAVVVADLLLRADPPHPNARIAVGVRADDAKNWLNTSLRSAAAALDAHGKA